MWTDLNRVTECMRYLAEVLHDLGYVLEGYKEIQLPSDSGVRLTWYESDKIKAALMTQYLSNLGALKAAFERADIPIDTPKTMKALTHTGANSIEELLAELHDIILRMQLTFVACGPATCGGDYF